MKVAFHLCCVIVGATIVNSFANEILLSKFIVRLGQEATSTIDICLINASKTTQNLVRNLAEDKFSVTFVHLSTQSTNYPLRCSVYLIFELLNDFIDASQQLDNLFLTDVWNPSGLFVFSFETSNAVETTGIYSRIVERYGLRRTLLQMHSKFAFHDIFAKQLTIFNMLDYDILRKLSPTEPLVNAHSYELRISGSNTLYPYFTKRSGDPMGPFVRVLNALSTTSNVTIRWLHKEKFSPNHSYMLESNQVNAVFFQNIYSTSTIRLASHFQDTTCLFLHERPIENYFILLLTPFTGLAWVSITSVAVVCIALGYLFGKYFPRNLLLMTFFGLPLPCHQLTRSERIVMLILNLLMLILSSAYLTKMLDIMYSLKYEHHIQTIREFGQSGVQVYSPDADERDRIRIVYPWWRVVGPEPGGKIPKYSAMAIRCVVAKFFIQSAFNPDPKTGRVRLYIVREPLFWDALVHSFAKSNPLVERFGEVWSRMYEAGIVQWLIERFVNEHYEKRKPFDEILLKFYDLITMWWILAYGYCGSGIVLLGEVGWDRFRKNRVSKFQREG
uniref:ionotropic receptor 163 n=1 Tax=Aedes aegypti TaxID=7159 RepID=UPI000C253CD4|nr:ionotropic receptor 163 [Aedes aegypti]